MESLEKILEKSSDDSFPNGSAQDYHRYYKNCVDMLKDVQSEAAIGAMTADIEKKLEEGEVVKAEELLHLNNHGPEHIKCVAKRCAQLLAASEHQLNGYEAYILLVAINLHDAGNVKGRDGHEKRVFEFIDDLGDSLGIDSVEKQEIGKIAAAHGGRYQGSKDTIHNLRPKQDILEKKFNPRFLAAILRFADELADDSTRASRYRLENDLLSEHSKIFHHYSNSLRSVKVDGDVVELSYNISHDVAKQRFSKGRESVYLLDEIYERILKMHLERVYCMRHLRGMVDVHKIRFQIDIAHPTDRLSFLTTITGTVEESGFPGEPESGLRTYCPDLETEDGLSIFNKIQSLEESDER